jgi:hypothetical protein
MDASGFKLLLDLLHIKCGESVIKICRFGLLVIMESHDFVPICEGCSGQFWGQSTSSNGNWHNFESTIG